MKKKILLIGILLVFVLANNFAQHAPFQTAITVHEADSVFKAHINIDHSIIIIDLRTPGEVANGFIEGAINHNYYGPAFDDTLANLDKEKEYLIYCASGGRSGGAFNKMKALEFKMVYNMIGGINAWRSAGYPVVTGSTGIIAFENNPNLVKLYPNPVTSESVFVNNEEYLPLQVRVLNIQGQTIFHLEIEAGMSLRLESEKLQKGVYFFQVYSEGIMIQNGKFMKTGPY